jgi:hypothetical protein
MSITSRRPLRWAAPTASSDDAFARFDQRETCRARDNGTASIIRVLLAYGKTLAERARGGGLRTRVTVTAETASGVTQSCPRVNSVRGQPETDARA